MELPENNNPIRLYREEIILAIAARLANTENATPNTLFSNFDTLPIARRVASFLPLPVSFLQKRLCDFVHHRLAAMVGTADARTDTILRQSAKYAKELVNVGLFLGTLEHCVQIQGGNFWQRYAPRKVWQATIVSGSNRRCETVWEFTPVIHAGTLLKITVPASLLTGDDAKLDATTILVSVILEEELKAGHFIWLREWLNGRFNKCSNNNGEEAVQAILEVVHYSAEQVHIRAVAHPYNGDFGFLNHPSYTVKYLNGWWCRGHEYVDDEENDETNDNDDDWLHEIWDMYVKPLSPWSSQELDDHENTNEYSQFWKQNLVQHVTLG